MSLWVASLGPAFLWARTGQGTPNRSSRPSREFQAERGFLGPAGDSRPGQGGRDGRDPDLNRPLFFHERSTCCLKWYIPSASIVISALLMPSSKSDLLPAHLPIASVIVTPMLLLVRVHLSVNWETNVWTHSVEASGIVFQPTS